MRASWPSIQATPAAGKPFPPSPPARVVLTLTGAGKAVAELTKARPEAKPRSPPEKPVGRATRPWLATPPPVGARPARRNSVAASFDTSVGEPFFACGLLPGPQMPSVRCCFVNHVSLGAASQAPPQGRSLSNATGGKVGFELATDHIQFYIFAD